MADAQVEMTIKGSPKDIGLDSAGRFFPNGAAAAAPGAPATVSQPVPSPLSLGQTCQEAVDNIYTNQLSHAFVIRANRITPYMLVSNLPQGPWVDVVGHLRSFGSANYRIQIHQKDSDGREKVLGAPNCSTQVKIPADAGVPRDDAGNIIPGYSAAPEPVKTANDDEVAREKTQVELAKLRAERARIEAEAAKILPAGPNPLDRLTTALDRFSSRLDAIEARVSQPPPAPAAASGLDGIRQAVELISMLKPVIAPPPAPAAPSGNGLGNLSFLEFHNLLQEQRDRGADEARRALQGKSGDIQIDPDHPISSALLQGLMGVLQLIREGGPAWMEYFQQRTGKDEPGKITEADIERMRQEEVERARKEAMEREKQRSPVSLPPPPPVVRIPAPPPPVAVTPPPAVLVAPPPAVPVAPPPAVPVAPPPARVVGVESISMNGGGSESESDEEEPELFPMPDTADDRRMWYVTNAMNVALGDMQDRRRVQQWVAVALAEWGQDELQQIGDQTDVSSAIELIDFWCARTVWAKIVELRLDAANDSSFRAAVLELIEAVKRSRSS